MLLSYIKLSFRRLIRNPFLTLINVVGLSIGYTAFYILWPYSQHELKSDQFHKDYEHIARLSRTYEFTENNLPIRVDLPMHNSGIARQFVRDYPEITELTGIIPQAFFETYRQGFDKDVFVSVENEDGTREFFREQNLTFADSNFFQFFSFPLEQGDTETILSLPNTAAVSSSYAVKYFGQRNPINKTIHFNDSVPVVIKGVFKDFLTNTHIKADVIISTAGIKQLNLTGWDTNWWGYYYIKVTPGTDFAALQKKINAQNVRIYGHCPRCPEHSSTSVLIQPLKTIVFTNIIGNTFVYKSKYLLIVLSALAFTIPVLAWINYISLSIHMLQKRLSELGVRKVVGAGGRHFVTQFLAEACLLNLLSVLIAITLVQLVKTPMESGLRFYNLPWKELPSSTLPILIALFVSGIVITGAYPILISMNKRSILLVKKTWSYKSPSWIKSIVTAQYSVAIILLIWIVCVYLQLNLILSTPLGIEKEGIMVIDCPLRQGDEFRKHLDYFTTQASTIPGVRGITVSKNVLGDFAGYGIPLQTNRNEIEFGFDINGGVDHNFVDVYGIKLLHGRNFHPEMPADQNAILVSRDATVRLGFSSPEEAVGARLILPWQDRDNVEVIGVYEDYEFRPFLVSFYQGARGSFLSYRNYLIPDLYPSKISVKADNASLQSSLPALKKLFTEVFPKDNFHLTFLDQNVERYYSMEKIARNQISVFTLIAIGVACLGLLGLVSNKVAEKRKEIGIRKILGAELYNIGKLLLHTTMFQFMIAVIIGIPVAYYLTDRYLEKFSERIDLQWWHFAIPVALLICIMICTVAAVIWKAATHNPVDALKHEQ